VIDMRRFSGLRKVLPVTHWSFLAGALALAGLIPFSGFWSKDQILEAVLHAGHASEPYGLFYFALFGVGLFTAGVTAFYTFRAYLRTFWGEEKIPEEAFHHHGHHDATAHEHRKPKFESKFALKMPLIVLAAGAIFVGGLLAIPNWINEFLANSPAFSHAGTAPPHDVNWWLIVGSTASAVAGIAMAIWMYRLRPGIAGKLMESIPVLHRASANRFYFDELYSWLVVRPANALAAILRFFDSIVDGVVDVVGLFPRSAARFLQWIQNGLVQFYALVMVVFLAAFVAIFVLWSR
jgi:NADH-quinone oxidoreductase subunit L